MDDIKIGDRITGNGEQGFTTEIMVRHWNEYWTKVAPAPEDGIFYVTYIQKYGGESIQYSARPGYEGPCVDKCYVQKVETTSQYNPEQQPWEETDI